MEFHEKLQELRKKRGLTQEELAEALYVSRTAISKWESGRGYPSIDSLKEISSYFSVTIDDLLSSEKLLFIAEKENGVVKYLDPQNDKSDASSYFAQGSKLSFGYFRMDDKQITADGALISQTVRKGVNNGSKQGP